MNRRSAPRTSPFQTIPPAVLDQVTGGRIAPRTTLDPVLLQGMQALSQAIVSVGQSMSAAKQSSMQMVMQVLEQMRGGRR